MLQRLWRGYLGMGYVRQPGVTPALPDQGASLMASPTSSGLPSGVRSSGSAACSRFPGDGAWRHRSKRIGANAMTRRVRPHPRSDRHGHGRAGRRRWAWSQRRRSLVFLATTDEVRLCSNLDHRSGEVVGAVQVGRPPSCQRQTRYLRPEPQSASRSRARWTRARGGAARRRRRYDTHDRHR